MRRFHFRLRPRRLFLALCACALFVSVWMGSFSHRGYTAYAIDESALVRAGVESYQSGEFLEAASAWRTAIEVYEATQDLPALATVSENLARAYQQMGQTDVEIRYWEKAIAATQSLDNFPTLSRLLTEQAQAYSRLGQQRRAIAILCGSEAEPCQAGSALQIAETAEDATAQLAALGSLGESYRLIGEGEKSLAYLERGYALSVDVDSPVLRSAIANSLGNTSSGLAQISYRRASEATVRGDILAAGPLQTKANDLNANAIEYFQQSYDLALAQQDTAAQMRALLSLVPAYERANALTTARQQRDLAVTILDDLPDALPKAFAAIKLADYLDPLEMRQSQTLLNTAVPTSANTSQAQVLLNKAMAIGESIDNSRVVSFALGRLGNLEERARRYESAVEKTQLARRAADQDFASKDSLYLWEWQLGRIQRAQGKGAAAGQSYSRAIALLEQIRSDILNSNRDLQFDFRDTVEPIYRQYAALNLEGVPSETIVQLGEPAFNEIDATLVALDSLKVAELQSYFANDCVIVPVARRVDAVENSRSTAVISTAILSSDEFSAGKQLATEAQQLAVIISLPDGSKKFSQSAVDEKVLKETINAFRKTLESGRSEYISEYNYAPSQDLYNWLIRPFEQDLAAVETLVFVNDGLLRSVPMAALHDGERYLIEKFAVATTPSLTLTEPEKVERPAALSALLMGVSKRPDVPGAAFGGLPSVIRELEIVAQQLPNSKTLLNEEFSIAALRQQLNNKDYRILHMATHGTFGFDPSDNFIVAGAKSETGEGTYNETLTISGLDALIRETSGPNRDPIELLTLTACETAIGDNRSTLGLAGVAIRAGVRSAIATLWSVSDDSSAQLISGFYNNLKTSELTKAQALQKAQVAMIESDDFVTVHPYRWAPFTLIGNWL